MATVRETESKQKQQTQLQRQPWPVSTNFDVKLNFMSADSYYHRVDLS